MELKKRVKESERLNASVVFSLEALDFLETEGSASLTELSGALGIHKSRVMRLCGTMERMGYVIRRGEDARYALGPRVLSLGKAFERHNPLLHVLRPQLERIARELDENVSFQIIRYDRRLCVCSVCRAQLARYVTPEGSEAKFPYGAAAKLMLAWGPAELRAKILAAAPYPRYTEHTPTTADEVLRAIEKTLKQGYAVSREERTYGTAALDVPVFGAGCELLGALGLASTTERLTPELIEKAVPALRKAAAYIQSMTAGAEKFVPKMPRRDE